MAKQGPNCTKGFYEQVVLPLERERDALIELEEAVMSWRAQGHAMGDESSFGPTPINRALTRLAEVRAAGKSPTSGPAQ